MSSFSSGPSSASHSSSSASGSSASSSNSFPYTPSLSKMKETIRNNLYEHVPVEEFVEHVWGFRGADIDRILDGKCYWNVPHNILRNYKQAYGRMNENSLAARRAGNVFVAFLDIVEEILQDIRTHLNDAVRPTNTVAFKYNADCFKADIPDIATVWDATSKPDWAVIQTIFEFERPSMPQLGDDLEPGDIYMASSRGNSVSENTSPYPSYSSRSSTYESLSSSTSATSSCGTNASFASTNAGSYQNQKRRNGNRSIASRRQKSRINKGELRLAQRALECLSSSCRRFMTGIYIDGCLVTLWYYDRMSIIRSRPFDFEYRPSYLALVLSAISRCGIRQAGYDPFHKFSNTPFRAQIPATSLKGSRLVIPSPGAAYCFQITRDKPIYSSHELIGRGTKVYPVILQPDEDEILVNEEEQVLKLYWPNAEDPLEADTIQQLLQVVPEITNHLPSISFSASFNRNELDLPSSRLEAYANSDPENRFLHVFTMKRYDKLWEVNSVEEFQEVFLDCVECHHHAYWKGNVLHRDLSENNLMVWRPRRSTVDPPESTSPLYHMRALGILNDWDMATHIVRYSGVTSVVTMVTNDQSLEVEALKNRTGTVPFMALDLLTDDGPTPRHLYRHDLESFLWILIWAAVHYDIPNKRNLSAIPGRIDEELKIWDEGTRGQVWAYKHALLRRASRSSPRSSNDDDFLDVLDRVRPEFQKLKSEWIIPLVRMFYRAYNELRYADVDEETCGGIVTFATFMAALKRTPRIATGSSNEDGWSSCIVI